MVNNTENYWAYGLCSSSGILNTRKHNVSETICFRPHLMGWETPTLLGPLELASITGSSGEGRETSILSVP
jgi:hypothetical protein